MRISIELGGDGHRHPGTILVIVPISVLVLIFVLISVLVLVSVFVLVFVFVHVVVLFVCLFVRHATMLGTENIDGAYMHCTLVERAFSFSFQFSFSFSFSFSF